MLHNLNVLAHALIITLLMVHFQHNSLFDNTLIDLKLPQLPTFVIK
jgi:hypothetical protein